MRRNPREDLVLHPFDVRLGRLLLPRGFVSADQVQFWSRRPDSNGSTAIVSLAQYVARVHTHFLHNLLLASGTCAVEGRSHRRFSLQLR